MNTSKDLGSCANVHMPIDDRQTGLTTDPNRNLLQNQAIDPNDRIWMNHNSVRMWNQQSPAYLTINWDIRTRHDTPEPMS